METKKVSYKEFYNARNEMQKELDEGSAILFPDKKYRRYVEIDADAYHNQPIESRVNWSALGAVPTETAIAYAQLLTLAAELAENFQYNGYVIDWSDED